MRELELELRRQLDWRLRLPNASILYRQKLSPLATNSSLLNCLRVM